MAHSLCEAPFAPFTIQQAGSTTSPMIDRGPVFAAGASPGFVDAVFAVFVVAFAPAGACAFAGAPLAGVTCTAPAVVLPCAPVRAGVHNGNRARARRANVIRVFIQDLHGTANGRGTRISNRSLTEFRDRRQEARPGPVRLLPDSSRMDHLVSRSISANARARTPSAGLRCGEYSV